MISAHNGLIISCLLFRKFVIYRERNLISFHRFSGDSNNLLVDLFAFDCFGFYRESWEKFYGEKSETLFVIYEDDFYVDFRKLKYLSFK